MASLWDYIKEDGIIAKSMPGAKPYVPDVELGQRRRLDASALPLSPKSEPYNATPATADYSGENFPNIMPSWDSVRKGIYGLPGIGHQLAAWDLLTMPGSPRQAPYLDEGQHPKVYPEEPKAMPPGQAPEQPVDNYMGDLVAEIQRVKEGLAGIYGPPPKFDTSVITDEAGKDRNRLKNLAALQMFAGVARDAGYPGMAAGLIGAGGVYDEGFERYRKAMIDAAKVAYGDQVEEYNYESGLTGKAADIVGSERKSKYQNEQKAVQDRMSFIDSYFGKMLDAKKDSISGDGQEIDDVMMRWRRSRESGNIVDSFDDLTNG